MIAKDIMTTEVITVEPETKVTEIARLLAENTISGVPVVDSSNKVIGIVTEEDLIIKRDYCKQAPRLALFGLWVAPDEKICKAYMEARGGTSAQDIMTKKVISFEEDTDVEEIANTMVKKKINRVPITRDGKLVGIIAREDIMKAYAGLE